MNYYKSFVEEYKGPRLAIIGCGCGFSFNKLLMIPGASEIIDYIYLPYKQSSIPLYDQHTYHGSYCGKTIVQKLLSGNMLQDLCDKDSIRIVASGNFIGKHVRIGLHEAYFGIANPNDFNDNSVYRIGLAKPTKEEFIRLENSGVLYRRREEEDDVLCTVILSMLLKKPITASKLLESFAAV